MSKRVVYIDLGNGLEQWDGVTEYWKDVVGYEGLYEVSTYGNIRNKITKKPRKINIGRGGYYNISLCKNSRYCSYFVHRLVATAFLDNTNNYPVVHHIDECKTNNRVDNLYWCSYKDNVAFSYDTIFSESNMLKKSISSSKEVEQYSLDGKLVATYKSTREAITKTGINNITKVIAGVYNSAGGYIWKSKTYKSNIKGKRLELYSLETGKTIKNFKSMQEAAKEIGVSYYTIYKCVNGLQNSCKGYGLREITTSP